MGAAMDDQRLVALAQEGNPDAFSLLVERHQTMVYNLALGKTGSPQDAEEVTQTAFLKAWQGLPAFPWKAVRQKPIPKDSNTVFSRVKKTFSGR